MTTHPSSAVTRPPRMRTAVLCAVAIIVAACGSTAETTNSVAPLAAPVDPAIDNTAASDAVVNETADPATDDVSRALAEPENPEDAAYGATLDEYLLKGRERPKATPPPEGFEAIDWDYLIPPGFTAAEISARFDERIAQVEPGSPEADEVFAELQAEFDNQPVNPDVDGDVVQLAGFVAPLTYEDDIITEFLLVPYFGACIHVPPPPVNQTIIVTLQDGEGLTIEESWGAVWVAGTLAVDGAETDLATAGYSITGAQTGVYDEY